MWVACSTSRNSGHQRICATFQELFHSAWLFLTPNPEAYLWPCQLPITTSNQLFWRKISIIDVSQGSKYISNNYCKICFLKLFKFCNLYSEINHKTGSVLLRDLLYLHFEHFGYWLPLWTDPKDNKNHNIWIPDMIGISFCLGIWNMRGCRDANWNNCKNFIAQKTDSCLYPFLNWYYDTFHTMLIEKTIAMVQLMRR